MVRTLITKKMKIEIAIAVHGPGPMLLPLLEGGRLDDGVDEVPVIEVGFDEGTNFSNVVVADCMNSVAPHPTIAVAPLSKRNFPAPGVGIGLDKVSQRPSMYAFQALNLTNKAALSNNPQWATLRSYMLLL